jgi:hypothetical protein
LLSDQVDGREMPGPVGDDATIAIQGSDTRVPDLPGCVAETLPIHRESSPEVPGSDFNDKAM